MSQESDVRVVTLTNLHHHPDADALDLAEVDGGYPVIVRRGEYVEGEVVIYIPVDTMVPTTGEFAFLDPKGTGKPHRIRAKKIRGVFSMGLVAKALPEDKVGDIVGERLGTSKYEEPGDDNWSGQGNSVKSPRKLSFSKYDIEGWRKYGPKVFTDPAEEVVVLEKLHGANARYVWARNEEGELTLFCGSRTQWKPFDDSSAWGVVARTYGLEATCRDLLGEGVTLFGEVLGVQDLLYGFKPSSPGFRVFEIYDASTGTYWDWNAVEDLCAKAGLETAPVLYRGPLSGVYSPAPAPRYQWLLKASRWLFRVNVGLAKRVQDWVKAKNEAIRALPRPPAPTPLATLAEGNTTLPGVNHVREGVVIRPVVYRFAKALGGRAILKLHGEGYLTRK
jgi:RNA ligase (TIGR02306 family)